MTAATFTAADGVAIAYDRWEGTEPARGLFIHATGFCKELWRPVRSALGAMDVDLGGVAFDQRGHGDSGNQDPPYRWSALGSDAATAASLLDGPVVGVGHSSGGAALCLAEIATPGRFLALVLVEPIVFPGPHGRLDDHPFVTSALRRRSWFASREEALANFSGRGPFAGWTAAALDLYVDHAFRQEGDRIVLKCPPETEAEFYREGGNHDTWEHLAAVTCPVLIVAGEHSDTHPAAFVAELADRFPEASSVIVPGAGHLVPMEKPESVAAAVAQVLP